jgi:hypothetical protein
MTRPAENDRADLVRQVVVLVGAVVAIVGAFLGSGAVGADQTQVGDGALAPEATLIAPARPAFAIWSVIYTGLTVWAIWQALPSRRRDPRQRRLGWLLLASLLLNAAWIAVVQAGLLGASVPVIVLLLGVLIAMAARLRTLPASGWWDRLVVDGTTGLYLGWVCVATIANVAAVLASAGYDELGLGGTTWAVVVLAVAGVLGVALAAWTRSPAASLAIAWGVAWVAVARSSGEPQSAVVSGVAVGVAVVAALAAVGAVVARARRPGLSRSGGAAVSAG